MPTISVIVPVYNVENHLKICVNSILAQTYSDFELILIDDGSTDSSGKICDEYAIIDNRIIVIHQTNQGQAAARNTAVQIAKGEWIHFVDSDDIIHIDYLEQLYNAAIITKSDVAVCQYTNNLNELNYSSFNSSDNISIFRAEDFYVKNRVNTIVPWGKIFRKNLFNSIRFPTDKYAEDEFTIYIPFFMANQVVTIQRLLYYYRLNNDGISKCKWSEKKIDGLIALQEQLIFFDKYEYTRAFEKTMYVFLLLNNEYFALINDDNISNDRKKHFISLISKKRKETISKYKNKFSFNTHKYFHELAYPQKMKAYWFFYGIYKKMRHVFGVNNGEN